MGDVAMTVPVLFALIRQYPNLRITVLTRTFFTPMFTTLPNVEVFRADLKGKHKGFLGLWGLFGEIKGKGIDVVADLHNVLRTQVLKRFFVLSGIPFYQIDKGRQEKKALTKEVGKDFRPLKTTHERYADVFGRLGFSLDLSHEFTINKGKLSKKVVGLTGAKTRKWLGIAPFATFPGKQYPSDLMEEVISRVSKTERYKIMLFGGGQQEIQLLDTWANMYDGCINVAGKLSFGGELALISNLDAMVSMDSGNGHLAAMYGVPVITLWGVTHPYAGFAPFEQDINNSLLSDRERYPSIPTSVYGNKCPAGYQQVMRTIEAETVVEKIEYVCFKK
nr:glycosyltransferase family 9 protein [Ulvibacterium sp.]